MAKITLDEQKIDQFLSRGVGNVYPNKEQMRELMGSGKKLKKINLEKQYHDLINLFCRCLTP